MPRWAMYASIVALSLLAHLKGITSPVLDYHYHRQANTASIARNYHRYDLPAWAPRVDWEGGKDERAATELPLYMYLVGRLWDVFELGDIWGRLVSVLCSAFSAVLLFWFLERDEKRKVGWLDTESSFLAALFFSFLPVEIYFGRTIQPEALALLATLGAFCGMDRFLAAKKWRAFGWWTLTVLSATVAIGHKLPYAYLIGVLGFLCLARRGWKAAVDPVIWGVPLVSLGLVYAWYRFASTGLYVVPTTKDVGIFRSILSYHRLPYFIFFQLTSRLPELALTYSGVLFFFVGFRERVFKKKQWFLAAWWGCVTVGILAGGGYSHHHEYTCLPWAPINAALMGAGCRALWTAHLWPFTRATVLALVLGMPLHAALRINSAHWYDWNFPYLLSARTVVDRVSGPDDLFLCNDRASSLSLYFIDRRGWSWDLGELGPGGLDRVEQVVAKGARYFMTTRTGPFADPKDAIYQWFTKRFPLIHRDDTILIFRLEPK